jgi:hypothetical protein
MKYGFIQDIFYFKKRINIGIMELTVYNERTTECGVWLFIVTRKWYELTE